MLLVCGALELRSRTAVELIVSIMFAIKLRENRSVDSSVVTAKPGVSTEQALRDFARCDNDFERA